jgi:hypothetical protein
MDEIQAGMAKYNVTYGGANGELPEPVSYDATDAALKQVAEESIRTGHIPGIQANPNVDLADFVIDRFPETVDVPYARLFCRPKTPFGKE